MLTLHPKPKTSAEGTAATSAAVHRTPWAMRIRCYLLFGLTLTLAVFVSGESPSPPTPATFAAKQPALAQIAIIIDDLGYHRRAGLRAAALPGAVTLAVLPFSPHTQGVADAGRVAGKELLLHVPMEPHNQVPWEPGGLSSSLSRAERQLALLKMLEAVPQVVGINNHMGSKFTEDAAAMDWLVDELADHQLFLIDSRTTAASRAWEAAQSAGLPSLKRDVFLDNVRDTAAIQRQLRQLYALAHQRGYALAIGHPHSATLQVLEEALPLLAKDGIELVPVSQLMITAGQHRLEPVPLNQPAPCDVSSCSNAGVIP